VRAPASFAEIIEGRYAEPSKRTNKRVRPVTRQKSKIVVQSRGRSEQERIQAKEALERKTEELALSLSMMQATLDSTTDAIVVTDLSGNVRDFNEPYAKMMGFPREVINSVDVRELRKTFSRQFKDPEQFLARVMEIYASAPPESFDVLEFADGRVFERYSKIQSIDKRSVGRVWSFRDVTERKRSEEKLQAAKIAAEKANRAKDRFLACMSHELRTPLNAIIGFTGTLLMGLPGPLTAEQRKQLETVKASAKYQLSLINDLLDLAKINSGKVELQLEPVACSDVVDEVADTLRSLAEQKGLSFEVNSPREFVLKTDRRALSQILINLTNNAIKFTHKGGIRIDVQQKNGATKILVADTGIGIDREDQAKLFDAFTRVESAGGDRAEGTGLGLHLSQKLAGLLGGVITFESERGKGSAFTLSIEHNQP
jgi:PAS domain S-box-containing protein